MHQEPATLYEQLGGSDKIKAVVEDLYRRISADERINHYFVGMDMNKQKEHQASFLSQILGGPEQYTGRSMRDAHAGLDLSRTDFDAVANHLVAALEDHEFAQVQIDEILSTIAKLEREIINT